MNGPGLPATEGKRFAQFDQQMDLARSGPTWLANPCIATAVVDTLFTANKQWKLCDLFA